MKRLLLAAALTAAGLGTLLAAWPPKVCALAGCMDTYQKTATDDISFRCETELCFGTYTKHWIVFFMDGYERRIEPSPTGELYRPRFKECVPEFRDPTFVNLTSTSSRWTQVTYNNTYNFSNGGCSKSTTAVKWTVGHTCPTTGDSNCVTPGFGGACPTGTTLSSNGLCCPSSGDTTTCSTTFASKCFTYGGDFDALSCTCTGCDYCGGSPVLVDVAGDGFALTGAGAGVLFDLNGNGTRDRLSWTAPGSDDAWLALDRDGSGSIESGRELFGDLTPQPAPPPGGSPNGFLALAEFDGPGRGGNSDGVIDAGDAVFALLRLWQDRDHDGVSGPGELYALPELDVARLHLDFKESRRVDEYGNRFKYRAKADDARGAKVGRWAWDVFLVAPPPPGE